MITEHKISEMCNASEPCETTFWIDAVSPTEEECALLAAKYTIPMEFIKAAFDKNEHPRVEEEGECLLVVARASILEPQDSPTPLTVLPVGIIVVPGAIITICTKEGVLSSMMHKKLRYTSDNLAHLMLLALLYRISTDFIEHLQVIIQQTEDIEKSLQESMQNRQILHLLRIEKSLIYLLTALKGNKSILEHLQEDDPLNFAPKETKMLHMASIEARQAIDMAEVFSQIVGSIADSFEAIVSNNVNKVMKVLTAITIVLMLPTLVAGVYGMNVPLPWQETEGVFIWLSIITAAATVGMGYYFWRKNWM